MLYRVKIQLQDTVLQFNTEVERDAAYEEAIIGLIEAGIPKDHIHLTKVDAQLSTFNGQMEEKVVGHYPPDPVPEPEPIPEPALEPEPDPE